jgi:hypothetical protein
MSDVFSVLNNVFVSFLKNDISRVVELQLYHHAVHRAFPDTAVRNTEHVIALIFVCTVVGVVGNLSGQVAGKLLINDQVGQLVDPLTSMNLQVVESAVEGHLRWAHSPEHSWELILVLDFQVDIEFSLLSQLRRGVPALNMAVSVNTLGEHLSVQEIVLPFEILLQGSQLGAEWRVGVEAEVVGSR